MRLHGIHLVSAAAKKHKAAQLRLACPPFFADVISDVHSQSTVHHWPVHREGSSEILHWGQESTLEAAKSAATAFIEDLIERERSARMA